MVEAVRQKAGADRTQRSSGESASDSENGTEASPSATGGRAEYVGRETGRSIDVVGERS